MLNSTQTIRLLTIDEAFDHQGVKIVYGECAFSFYSKDGVTEDTISYRTKGAAAVAISESGVNATGVAIGYLDIAVVDTCKGYKEKKTTLVTRTFIPTASEPTPQKTTQQLVGVAGATAATAANNNYVPTTDNSKIPF